MENENLKELKGELLIHCLTNGYKIIEHKYDGEDWHLLLEQTDKFKLSEEAIKWKYLLFKTQNHFVNSDSFSHMVSYRSDSKRKVLNKFMESFIEDKLYKERQRNKKLDVS